MQTHICGKCGVRKKISEFSKRHSEGPLEAWNLRYCKACIHEQYVERYAKPVHRKAQLDASLTWKQRNPEEHARINKAYRDRHPERIMAQNRLNYAIRKGRVKRLPCEICGCKKSHAHHASYDPKDWYNVKWLCYVCHKIEHG